LGWGVFFGLLIESLLWKVPTQGIRMVDPVVFREASC
jgi:hypothetical protein